MFVTHDQEEALTLSDRIALLDAGRLVQSGPPQAVCTNVRRRVFAADFLGDANFFTARVGGDGRLLASWGRELLGVEAPDGAAGEVTLAVRPEKLRITRAGEPEPDGANGLSGTVTSVLYAGSTITYGVACGDVVVTVLEQEPGGPAPSPRGSR